MPKKKASFAPYLFDEYKDAVETPMDWDQRLSGYEKWSEYKKPYQWDHHEKSERVGDNKGGGSYRFYRPPGGFKAGGGGKGPIYFPSSCEPEAKLAGGSWAECECDVDCCVTMLVTCPDSVLGVTIGNQSPGSAGPSRDARKSVERTNKGLIVTQCGFNKEDNVVVDVSLKGPGIGPHVKLNAADRSAAACNDCTVSRTVSIKYTSQYMVLSGTQNISASGGVGPYTWALASGSGTLGTAQTEEGVNTLYSAPATNPDCTYNPTITVTDICNNTAQLKIAVNNTGVSGTAMKRVFRQGTPHPSGCGVGTPCSDCPSIKQQSLTCAGSMSTQSDCVVSYSRGLGPFPPYDWHCCMEAAGPCTDASWATLEAACNCVGLDDDPSNCAERYVDVRTVSMKSNGCCPVELL